MPAAMTGATSGTMSRLTAGAMTASRPNEATTTGSVASCAARDTPRLSASQRGARPPDRRSIHSVAAAPQAISPAVARVESWKPASPISAGSTTSRPTAAQPERGRCPAGPARLAGDQDDAGHRTGAQDRRRGAGERDVGRDGHDRHAVRRRRPRRPATAATAAATMAMFQPEMATTWLTPAVVNASATSRSTRSRSPMRMPAARPASGSGQDGGRARPRRPAAGPPARRQVHRLPT